MDNQKDSKQQQRINDAIQRMDDQAQALIDGADLDELSSKERLDLAVKFISLKQRFLLIAQQQQAATPQGRTEIMLTAIMRQMRGEPGEPLALPLIEPVETEIE